MLSADAQRIHARALYLSKVHRKVEIKIVEILLRVLEQKIHRQLGHPSLFDYVVKRLELSEAQAYALCSVAKKSRELPELKTALERGRLSTYKASRVISVVTPENVTDVISYAETSTTRDLEKYVARLRPQAAVPDRVRALAQDLVHLQMSISEACFNKLNRVQDLLASKQTGHGYAQVLEAALDAYLHAHDPLAKAKRAEEGKQKRQAQTDGPLRNEEGTVAYKVYRSTAKIKLQIVRNQVRLHSIPGSTPKQSTPRKVSVRAERARR